MDGRGVCPSEPEEADGEEDGAEEGGGQAGFRGCAGGGAGCGGGGGDAVVTFVVRDGVDDCREHAHRDAEEGEATDTLGPATGALIHDRKSAEHEVQRPIYDRHIDTQK